MGYQEVAKKINNLKEVKIIENAIVRDSMSAFIELIGVYKNPNKLDEFYVFWGTDRHPGADYLIKNFNAKTAESLEEELKGELELMFEYWDFLSPAQIFR